MPPPQPRPPPRAAPPVFLPAANQVLLCVFAGHWDPVPALAPAGKEDEAEGLRQLAGRLLAAATHGWPHGPAAQASLRRLLPAGLVRRIASGSSAGAAGDAAALAAALVEDCRSPELVA